MPGAILYVKHPVSGELIPVKADADGKLVISDADPFTVAQDTPENLKHVPHGFYAAGPSYLPFKVDADGVLQTGGAVTGALNDLSDVSVPAPTDQDLFYYDSATGLWKSRALVDADIPAAIARDTEVSAAIAAQKLDDHAAPDNNTDNNATAAVHGLLPKLSNVVTEFLNGQGAWAVPAGGGGGATVAFTNTVVWDGSSATPTSFTDLDLSAVVGANAAIVILKVVVETTGTGQVSFRTNGETIANYVGYIGIVPSTTVPYMGYAVVVTDSAGVVEWKSAAARTGDILTVIAYAKA